MLIGQARTAPARRPRQRRRPRDPAHGERRGQGTIPADTSGSTSRKKYGVPWTILAGIGTVESNNGQTSLPGVHSGQNGFGAAGPMQIGIEGASGNTWGGAPIHPASQVVVRRGHRRERRRAPRTCTTRADAIAGAAKYLLNANVQANPSAAIFAYNHLQSLRAERADVRGPVRGRQLLGGVRAAAGGAIRRRAACRRQAACPRSRRPPRPWPPRSRSPSSSWASRTCGAAPARTRSTAPA